MNEALTCQGFLEHLEQVFPDCLQKIWAVRVSNHPAAVTADLLTSDVFVDRFFRGWPGVVVLRPWQPGGP